MCRTTNYVITYLLILCVTLVMTRVQMHPQSLLKREFKPIIQNVNKNINVIVNLDPREVAEELWKVIEARLSNGTSHITNSQSAIRDLESAVQPLLSPARRDGTSPSAFQVASQLDKITRRVLTRDTPTMNTLDEEIMTRDIVADMMASLKMLISETIESNIEEADAHARRTIYNPFAINSNEREDYVNITIKINKKDLINICT